MDTDLVAICGLYCGTCPSYLATRKGDTAQLRLWAASMSLTEEDVQCGGCLSSHVAKPCRECVHGFRACAAAHSVTWCFECEEFPCDRLFRFRDAHVVDGVSHHASVIEDLSFMRENGVQAWLDRQEERSKCPECGTAHYWFARFCSNCGAQLRK